MRTTGSPVPAVSTLSDSARPSETLNVSTVVELSASSRTDNSHTGRCLHGNGGCRGGRSPHGCMETRFRAAGSLSSATSSYYPACAPFGWKTAASASGTRRPRSPRPAKRWCASYAPESATPTSSSPGATTRPPESRGTNSSASSNGAVPSSPRQRPSVAEEPPGRPVVRQRRRPHDARRAFGDGPSTRAAHVGGHPTGADRVHQDAVLPELGREHTGEGVEGRLRETVGRGAAAHSGQRPCLARHIHHARVAALSQQRQEGAQHAPGAEQVRFERLTDLGEV